MPGDPHEHWTSGGSSGRDPVFMLHRTKNPKSRKPRYSAPIGGSSSSGFLRCNIPVVHRNICGSATNQFFLFFRFLKNDYFSGAYGPDFLFLIFQIFKFFDFHTPNFFSRDGPRKIFPSRARIRILIKRT